MGLIPRALLDRIFKGAWQVDVYVERAGYFVNEFSLGLFFLEALSLAVLNPLFSLDIATSKKRFLRGILIDFVEELCFSLDFSLFMCLSFLSNGIIKVDYHD